VSIFHIRIKQNKGILMTQTYVLDTSVLLSNPKSIFMYGANKIVLPLVVIKELESKRHDPELGYYARTALRQLEELRVTQGDLREGVIVNPEGGTLKIEINHVSRASLPEILKTDPSHDTRILAVAAALSEEGENVTVVSKDLPMRLLASTITGLHALDHVDDNIRDSGYKGLHEVTISKEKMDELYESHTMTLAELGITDKIPANCGLNLKTGSRGGALARLDHRGKVTLIPQDLEAFGVRGRSAQQRIALAHLLDNNIGIVSLGGPGGTGKSMLALAAGLEAVLERKSHQKIVVFRPLYPVGGQELGYLPGSAEEKMNPWSAAVFDALDAFCSKNVIDEIISRGLIEVLPLTHIRGRTFTDTIMIIDEAQNLEKNVLLTALSRTGDNTRVFISSDIAQRDNLRVGRHDGISNVVEKLKGEELFAHVMLTRSERSKVAELVTRLLDE
jgi:PhoH-like ATPase